MRKSAAARAGSATRAEPAATVPVHQPMRATQHSSDCAWTEAMRAGDFQRAWEINDLDLAQRVAERAPKHEGPRHLQQIWRGEPLRDARVLVRCYHGLGDTIQFIRFAKPLRRIAREVTVWAQPELLRRIQDVEGVDHVLPLHDGTCDAKYDVDIEVMELAHALRATPCAISQAVPYLRAPLRSSHVAYPALEPECFHIGLVWRAGDWDLRRSVDLARLAPLAHIPGIRLHLLQPTQVSERPIPFPARDRARSKIDDAAAVIADLDLVITVDTMMAHLAGAMAVPAWTMLCQCCDWRWGGGESTPWYPGMRLFRQTRSGHWDLVVEQMCAALAQIVRERTKERV